MKLLILGGTVFLGRHLVEAARGRGHQITLFNRGRTNPELHPDVEKLRGDRAGDLSALRGRTWDVVIDTCGFVPRVVKASAQALANAVERYVFISSISVYPKLTQPGLSEDSPVAILEDPAVEEVTAETYGPLKAACEEALGLMLPGRVLAIRPGLIVGPFDPSDRFTYWPSRVARGGETLAPEWRERRVQLIDARDLAEWIVRMAESKAVGTFNATGPEVPPPMRQILDECKAASGSAAEFTWVGEAFLQAQKVVPYTEMPLWIPGADDSVNCKRALGQGLRFRPLAETIRETLAWDATRPPGPRKCGLRPEREAEILAAWRNRS